LEMELAPLKTSGRVQMTRIAANERALEAALRTDTWHVIHFIGQGSSRPAARYGTLSFAGSDGRVRAVNAQNLARLVGRSASVGAVVLQAVARRTPLQDFEVVTQALLDSGLAAAIWLPDFSAPQVAAVFAREFYGALAFGDPLDVAA